MCAHHNLGEMTGLSDVPPISPPRVKSTCQMLNRVCWLPFVAHWGSVSEGNKQVEPSAPILQAWYLSVSIEYLSDYPWCFSSIQELETFQRNGGEDREAARRSELSYCAMHFVIKDSLSAYKSTKNTTCERSTGINACRVSTVFRPKR